MRRIAGIILILFFCAGVVWAQDDATAGGETQEPVGGAVFELVEGPEIVVHGQMELFWLNRGSQINFAEALGTHTTGGFTGRAALDWDIWVSDQVSARLQLETLNHDGTDITYFSGGNNASANQELDLEQAYINYAGLFSDMLNIRIGLQDVSYKLRPQDTGSYFISLDEGQNHGVAGPATAMADVFGTHSNNDPVGILLNFSGTTEFTRWTLDLLHVTVVERSPAVNDDTVLTSAFYHVEWGEAGRWVDSNLSIYSGVDGMEFYDLGFGVVWGELGDLEGLAPFGEIHKQFGDLNRNVDMAGVFFRMGARWDIPDMDNHPWFELAFVSFSGDDDAGDSDADGYYAQDDNDDFVILESNDFGFDIDTNYDSFRLAAGITTTLNVAGVEGEDNLAVWFKIGGFTIQETAPGVDDELGTEVDLNIRWDVSEGLSLVAVGAVLAGSGALEQATAFDPDVEDNMTELFLLGAELGF